MCPAPLISVVIAAVNHKRFLGEALGSVVCLGRPVEMVVVDDESIDGTAAARNRGLDGCRGRYVVFLDADERLAPRALDAGAAALDEHPEAAFVFGRCVIISTSGEPLPTPVYPPIVRDHYRELLRRNFIWTPAMVMFRREAVERVGGFSTLVNAAADYDLYLHIARHHPVHDHAQVVAHSRRQDATIRDDASLMLRETLGVLRSQRPFLEGDGPSLEAYREGRRWWQEFYGTRLVNEIRADVEAGAWLEAARKAGTLGRHHPRGLAHHAMQKIRVTFRRRESSLAPGG